MNSPAKSSFCSRARAGQPRLPLRGRSAFTLIEVMIAMGIFFMAIFAILELVSECLRNARLIQREHMDTTPVMTFVYTTNTFTEGTQTVDFDGTDFKDFKGELDCHADDIQGSNGLWNIQAIISDRYGASETNYAFRWGNPPPENGVH